jgi:biopolymer transport protein TolR
MAISFGKPGGDGDEFSYKPMSEINVTPLVDVMLVLLIIFMVAAPLMVQGVPVDLPKTTATRLAQLKKPMIVTLAKDGGLYLRDERIESAALIEKLTELRRTEGDTVVYVRADRTAAYGEVMELLGRVGATGYERVSLLANAPSATPATPAAAK